MIQLLESPTTNPERAETLVELLQYRAKTQGDRVGYIFLADGETEEVRLTYAALDRQARAIASQLQGFRGERALLLYPPSLEYICALFGSLLLDRAVQNASSMRRASL